MLNYIYINIIYIVLSSQTLTADNYGEHFLSSGTLDLWGKAIWIKSSHNKVPYTFSSFIHKHCQNKSNKRPIGHIAHTYNSPCTCICWWFSGGEPNSLCTSNQFWGCSRQGSPEHIINPIQSARLRSDKAFNFKYGKMEVRAKMPKGDWIWPGDFLSVFLNTNYIGHFTFITCI